MKNAGAIANFPISLSCWLFDKNNNIIASAKVAPEPPILWNTSKNGVVTTFGMAFPAAKAALFWSAKANKAGLAIPPVIRFEPWIPHDHNKLFINDKITIPGKEAPTAVIGPVNKTLATSWIFLNGDTSNPIRIANERKMTTNPGINAANDFATDGGTESGIFITIFFLTIKLKTSIVKIDIIIATNKPWLPNLVKGIIPFIDSPVFSIIKVNGVTRKNESSDKITPETSSSL